MDNTQFTKLADAELSSLYDMLDVALPNDEVDLLGDVLYLTTEQGSYVINRHAPSQQIWLSSPISGGDYFDYDPINSTWINKHQHTLRQKLQDDLNISLLK